VAGRFDQHVADGDSIALGQHEVRVLHTPGHTPGGITLAVPGHLFTGDTLFPGGPWPHRVAAVRLRHHHDLGPTTADRVPTGHRRSPRPRPQHHHRPRTPCREPLARTRLVNSCWCACKYYQAPAKTPFSTTKRRGSAPALGSRKRRLRACLVVLAHAPSEEGVRGGVGSTRGGGVWGRRRVGRGVGRW